MRRIYRLLIFQKSSSQFNLVLTQISFRTSKEIIQLLFKRILQDASLKSVSQVRKKKIFNTLWILFETMIESQMNKTKILLSRINLIISHTLGEMQLPNFLLLFLLICSAYGLKFHLIRITIRKQLSFSFFHCRQNNFDIL